MTGTCTCHMHMHMHMRAHALVVVGEKCLHGWLVWCEMSYSHMFQIGHVWSRPTRRTMEPLIDMACAGLANGVSTGLLNPSDVTKLRLQSAGGELLYPGGLIDVVRRICADEGAAALWTTGLTSTLLREVFYSTTRMGLYPHVKQQLGVDNSLIGKIAAGSLTGGLGSIISNPIDVVKVGVMAESGAIGSDGRYVTGLRAGHKPTWPSTIVGLHAVFAEGISMRGATASVARGMLMAASQLASYDHSKHLLRDSVGVPDSTGLHVVCSQISAVVSTIVTAPADMLKTRVMGDRVGAYAGVLDCLKQTLQQDGLLSLWRGALPSFLRLGPHFIMTFPLYESLRRRAGLGYL